MRTWKVHPGTAMLSSVVCSMYVRVWAVTQTSGVSGIDAAEYALKIQGVEAEIADTKAARDRAQSKLSSTATAHVSPYVCSAVCVVLCIRSSLYACVAVCQFVSVQVIRSARKDFSLSSCFTVSVRLSMGRPWKCWGSRVDRCFCVCTLLWDLSLWTSRACARVYYSQPVWFFYAHYYVSWKFYWLLRTLTRHHSGPVGVLGCCVVFSWL